MCSTCSFMLRKSRRACFAQVIIAHLKYSKNSENLPKLQTRYIKNDVYTEIMFTIIHLQNKNTKILVWFKMCKHLKSIWLFPLSSQKNSSQFLVTTVSHHQTKRVSLSNSLSIFQERNILTKIVIGKKSYETFCNTNQDGYWCSSGQQWLHNWNRPPNSTVLSRQTSYLLC